MWGEGGPQMPSSRFDITLPELAFSVFVYRSMESFDVSLSQLWECTGGEPDLLLKDHRQALIRWLNQWGCRQFALEYHQVASENLLSWYRDFGARLVAHGKHLWELNDDELMAAGEAYAALSKRVASLKDRDGKLLPVSIGPTGASKILFSLRPQVFVAWDGPIRRALGHNGGLDSYVKYLQQVRSSLENIEKICHANGFGLNELPHKLGSPESSLPKLIGEHLWVTLTRQCAPPTSEVFHRWARWS